MEVWAKRPFCGPGRPCVVPGALGNPVMRCRHLHGGESCYFVLRGWR